MSEEVHQHTDKTYAIEDKDTNVVLVCKDCHPEELKGGNECFCKCHTKGNTKSCPACSKYHKTNA